MRVSERLPDANNGLWQPYNKAIQCLIATVLLFILPKLATATTVDIQVHGGLGGAVATVPGNIECSQNCRIQQFPNTLVSLFAVPEPGYRFLGWDGECATTIGPLCTFKLGNDTTVTARFAKAKANPEHAHAVLLLHGNAATASVWNDYAKQHFNNRCPVVYGGVLLEQDSYDKSSNLYCYRVAFGYYNALIDPNKHLTKRSKGNRLSNNYHAYEIRAATLGILERHPKLSVTLVGQGDAAIAARNYMAANTSERKHIEGLRTLAVPAITKATLQNQPFNQLGIHGQTALKPTANPKQRGN
jgi:Divergent InlB B-repeat domain